MTTTAEITVASKELVDSLLAMNTDNRNVRRHIVSAYRAEIISGNWRLTNQGIGVSRSGVLVDGQHRLIAIKDSGYPPVPLLIVRGIDDDAQLYVDGHAKRTMRDMLAFAFKERVSRSAPAICRNLIEKRNGTDMHRYPSVSEILDIMEEYRMEIDAVIDTPNSGSFFSAAILTGFVYVAKDKENIQGVCDFVKMVESGESLTKAMPAYHLRNLAVLRDRRGSSAIHDRMEKTIRATSAYLAGKEMFILRA